MTATAERAGVDIPVEADLDRAPGLLDGAMSLDLTPQQCNLEYWLGAVAQGTLRGLVKGQPQGLKDSLNIGMNIIRNILDSHAERCPQAVRKRFQEMFQITE